MRGGAQCIHLSPEGQAILSSRALTRLRRRVHKGIPEPLRALSWKVMSGAGELAEQRRNEYRELKKRVLAGEVPEETRELIELDLQRTYPEHVLWLRGAAASSGFGDICDFTFFESGHSGRQRRMSGGDDAPPGVGCELLGWLLNCYALHDPAVRYCQAMNFVGAALVIYAAEEDAFWLFSTLMQGFGLRGLYVPSLTLLTGCLESLKTELSRGLPNLLAHFKRHAIEPSVSLSPHFSNCPTQFKFFL